MLSQRHLAREEFSETSFGSSDMKTVLSLSTLLLATAALAGKSPAAVKADIDHAAAEVCASAARSGDIGFFELRDCVRTVAAEGMQQAARVLKPA